MNNSWQIPRRTFLRGVGTAMALPMLDVMIPSGARAADASKAPKRMAFVYIPNGVVQRHWTPNAEGSSFGLQRIMEPLAPHRENLLILTGLAHDKARANGDGPGDHARANATFLTGCQARKTSGSDIRAGVSVDQVFVQQTKEKTRLPSLELSSDGPRMTGNCDSGYSCAYQFNLAWRNEATPLPPESNPALVFERMFGNGNKAQQAQSTQRRLETRKSLLDFVREDAQQLERKLGRTDKRKLDEYFTAVREMELRVNAMAKAPRGLPEGYSVPDGKPRDFGDHVRMMLDMMTLAFQTDQTRVATYLLAHDGDNRSYPHIGVRGGHHSISHHRNNADNLEMLTRINRYHCSLFAHFLDRLKSVKEGDGTLLDHTLIVYGGAIGDGDRHSHHDLPVILAGKGGGAVRPGRHVRYPKDTPMANLLLSMLNIMGTPTQRLGDSTGSLQGLS